MILQLTNLVVSAAFRKDVRVAWSDTVLFKPLFKNAKSIVSRSKRTQQNTAPWQKHALFRALLLPLHGSQRLEKTSMFSFSFINRMDVLNPSQFQRSFKTNTSVAKELLTLNNKKILLTGILSKNLLDEVGRNTETSAFAIQWRKTSCNKSECPKAFPCPTCENLFKKLAFCSKS